MGTFIRVHGLEITNTNAPTLAPPLHGVGVDGYFARYLASDLTAPTGSVVTTLPARIGEPLNSVLGTPSVTVQDEAGLRFVRSTVARDAGGQLISATNLPGSQYSFAAVIRDTTRVRYTVSVSGYEVQASSSGTWRLGSWSGGQATGTAPAGDWSLVVAVGDLTDSFYNANGARQNANITTRSELPIAFGPVSAPTSGAADMIELVAWNRALTDAEVETIRAAFKAKYPFLP